MLEHVAIREYGPNTFLENLSKKKFMGWIPTCVYAKKTKKTRHHSYLIFLLFIYQMGRLKLRKMGEN